MRTAQDEVLNLRLPRALRADLDGAARDHGGKISTIAREALRLGLRMIRSSASGDDPPPPAAPAASAPIPAAA